MSERSKPTGPGRSGEVSLGPIRRDEPTSRELVEAVSSAEGGEAAEAARFLLRHPDVARAARAGFDELERQEQSTHHRTVTVEVPRGRAAAATEEPLAAPFPEDHQLLAEEQGRWRLVYFRRASTGYAALFTAATEVRLDRASVDGAPLRPEPTPDVRETVLDLGSTLALAGRRLEIQLLVAGEPRSLSYTFVPHRVEGEHGF